MLGKRQVAAPLMAQRPAHGALRLAHRRFQPGEGVGIQLAGLRLSGKPQRPSPCQFGHQTLVLAFALFAPAASRPGQHCAVRRQRGRHVAPCGHASTVGQRFLWLVLRDATAKDSTSRAVCADITTDQARSRSGPATGPTTTPQGRGHRPFGAPCSRPAARVRPGTARSPQRDQRPDHSAQSSASHAPSMGRRPVSLLAGSTGFPSRRRTERAERSVLARTLAGLPHRGCCPGRPRAVSSAARNRPTALASTSAAGRRSSGQRATSAVAQAAQSSMAE